MDLIRVDAIFLERHEADRKMQTYKQTNKQKKATNKQINKQTNKQTNMLLTYYWEDKKTRSKQKT
jgi:hypothetical protein